MRGGEAIATAGESVGFWEAGFSPSDFSVAGVSLRGFGGGGTPVVFRSAGSSLFRAGLGCSSRMGMGDVGMTFGGADKLRLQRLRPRWRRRASRLHHFLTFGMRL